GWLKRKIRSRIADLVRVEVRRAAEEMLPLVTQLIEFRNSPQEDRQSYHDRTRLPLDERERSDAGLKDRLLSAGIPMEEVEIDTADFDCWLNDFPGLRKYYESMGDVSIEKCLEHYLAFRHLDIAGAGVYIDIAADQSPWAKILNKKGIKSYRLDLAYPEGIRGLDIGADAGNTKLPPGFCSVISAQCACECFTGDGDIRFVKEAARILKNEGRCGIVPLYLDDSYFILTSPYCDQKKVKIDSGARRVWRDDEYQEPFSRHYSPEVFQRRIYANLPDSLTGKVLYFRNLADVVNRYQGQRIYCRFMFVCKKDR
ncbi:MAG: hypothetical protein WC552_09930, partial [Candidatus Omnitrophota bacterium]